MEKIFSTLSIDHKKVLYYEKVSFSSSSFCCSFSCPPLAHSANHFNSFDIYNGAGVVLFKKGAEIDSVTGFRIPAIAAVNGFLIAGTDVRYTGGDRDLAHEAIHRTKLGTKISYDGGKTWTDLAVHNASSSNNEYDFMNCATDPTIIIDKSNDTLFMFGFRSNANVANGSVLKPANRPNNQVDNIPQQVDSDLLMFTSRDGGKSWDVKDLTDEVLGQINKNQTNKKFSNVLQGPGGGMVYGGKIYVPIQTWATRAYINDNQKFVSTSGFMVSEDGGKSWQVSKMLIPDVSKKLDGSDKMNNTSESNIFYHKGKIRLAVKNEGGDKYTGGRFCFEYTKNEVSGEWEWVKVEENFLPTNITSIETSTHSLSEDVYALAYSVNDRRDPVLATNTGIKIQLTTGKGLGYTSITSDDDNIYVLYEGVDGNTYSQMFKAIDWKHKDYAVLNTQIRDRANTINYMQGKFSKESNYILGSYGSDTGNVEIVGSAGSLKGGIFVNNQREINKDNHAVSEYDTFDVALLIGLESSIADKLKGTGMIGYMNSGIEYANGSENDVSSFVGGYQINYQGDYFGVRSGFNFIYSDNSLQRNRNEGLGKKADFNSESISISNELYKDVELGQYGDLELATGLVNTFFKHDSFREVGGEGTDENGLLGANNATLKKSSLQSHELYIKASWDSKPFTLSEFANVTFNTDLKYAIDFADTDKWKDDYRTMSVDREYKDIGELYSARDSGLFTAEVGANLEIIKQINISLKGVADTRGEYSARLEGKLSL